MSPKFRTFYGDSPAVEALAAKPDRFGIEVAQGPVQLTGGWLRCSWQQTDVSGDISIPFEELTMIARKFSMFSAFAAAMMMCFTAPAISRAADDVSAGDKKFVMNASQAGMTEVASAKAALATSTNADVKKFAQKMVDDHTKANEELMAYAKGKNLEVPATLDSKHEAMVDKLKGKEGAEFDKAYIGMMVKDHKKVVDMFEKAAARSDDSALAQWAGKTLPILKEHETMAATLAGGMGIKADDHDMNHKEHDGDHDMGK